MLAKVDGRLRRARDAQRQDPEKEHRSVHSPVAVVAGQQSSAGRIFARLVPGWRRGEQLSALSGQSGLLGGWGGSVALSLREYALKHVQRPYQPFYVELVGELLGRRADGAAAGYDDVVRVHSVEAISQQLPVVCQDLPPEG